MIVYCSVPYALNNVSSQNKAMAALNKMLGKLYSNQPQAIAVSGLYSTYNNPDAPTKGPRNEMEVFPYSRLLIDASDILVVIMLPGWEYDHIVVNEVGYAAVRNKRIIYEAPITDEQKL